MRLDNSQYISNLEQCTFKCIVSYPVLLNNINIVCGILDFGIGAFAKLCDAVYEKSNVHVDDCSQNNLINLRRFFKASFFLTKNL